MQSFKTQHQAWAWISKKITIKNFVVFILCVFVVGYLSSSYISDIFKHDAPLPKKEPKWIPRMKLRPKITLKPGRIFMMILITSPPNSLDYREAIRETWGQSLLANSSKLDSRLVFVVGCSKSVHLDNEVDEEAKDYVDIFRSPYIDTPRNEIAKVWKAYYWAARYEPQFIVKTRDDVYIYLPSLLKWLHKRPPKEKLYAGKVINHAAVIRDKKDLFYVSKHDFQESNYPDYCAGPFYIFSGSLLEKLVQLSSKIEMFQVEDAYFGLLMKKAEVLAVDIRDWVYIDAAARYKVPSWPNRGYADVFCIAYSIPPHLFQSIANRYKKIKHTIEAESHHN